MAKPPSLLAAVWRSMTVLLIRQTDMSAHQAKRIASLEDRLAALDGGHDAHAAARAALDRANAGRVTEGAAPLAFTISAKGGISWTGKARLGE
ncbi:MAG: hypothetical protein KF723_22720 [Rhizobiaceae bacterium]|nr:hypothetical protein [Rhizobiaceae bacterium]